MKYFTLDILQELIAKQDYNVVDNVVDAMAVAQRRRNYNDYLDSIVDQLPKDLVRLNKRITMGLAELHTIRVDINQSNSLLVLRAEDNITQREKGVILEYKEVRTFKSTSFRLISSPSTTSLSL